MPIHTLPQIGTPDFDAFVKKATQHPDSIEGKVWQQMQLDAVNEGQRRMRELLQLMIEKVPGQLYRDVVLFHNKFKLQETDHPGHVLPRDVTKFRLKFLLEELVEYADAVDFRLVVEEDGPTFVEDRGDIGIHAEKAFDSLIDLVYVALGTAFLHRFPFNEGWDRVQEANMSKVRAEGADDPRSVRKHTCDVVKPQGWQAPVLTDLLYK